MAPQLYQHLKSLPLLLIEDLESKRIEYLLLVRKWALCTLLLQFLGILTFRV